MADVTVADLSSFVFKPTHPSLHRDRLVDLAERDQAHDEQYDFYTLFYDCFFDEGESELVLVAPPLANFERLIIGAEFTADGRTVTPVVDHMSRCSVVRLKVSAPCPKWLRVSHKHFSGEVEIRPSQFNAFKGKNAIFAINKNNKLEWIHDWATYYAQKHKANAVLLFDNASDEYGPEDLASILKAVDGLQTVRVVNAPFPFGPRAPIKSHYGSLFLQRSMAELARRKYLGRARAVLGVDIDELFHSRSGQSIFDATVASPSGYLRADAVWVYAPEGMKTADFSDHLYRSERRRPNSNRKWCVVPDTRKPHEQWLTHKVARRPDLIDPDFIMWHFRQVTTNWKGNRERRPDDLVRDHELEDAFF